jgi:hypothetical protein
MVFIEYKPGSKAYRFYSPDTGHVIISRDVVFEEAKAWDWSSVSRSSTAGAKLFHVEFSMVTLHGADPVGPE